MRPRYCFLNSIYIYIYTHYNILSYAPSSYIYIYIYIFMYIRTKVLVMNINTLKMFFDANSHKMPACSDTWKMSLSGEGIWRIAARSLARAATVL